MSRLDIRALAAIAVIVSAACSDATGVTETAAAAEENTPKSTSDCPVPAALSVGQVLTGLSGTGLCFGSATTGGEFALISFNASSQPTATPVTLTLNGTSSAVTAAASLASSGVQLLSTSNAARGARVPGFEQRLRALERTKLPRLMSAARSWRATRTSRSGSSARFSISPSAPIGAIVQLNGNSESACGAPSYRAGRVAAISNRAIVVADTGNPAGGFSDTDYASIAAAFDTLIDPVDRLNFGDPTDIDENGHVVLFFTNAVNELTPAKSDSYVAGFFFARDLFPTAGLSSEGCAGSNVSEMFYLMVPDPSGKVNGNVFTTKDVSESALSTVAHEYQHLINASRRIYVNNADDLEDGWLDEGLSHIAEELAFYKASGLSTGANLSATTLRASALGVAAVNEYQIANLGRYSIYLERPESSSPYAPNDSLSTRGATWSFLRYLADRRGGDQASLWRSLVNSTTSGFTNLATVFGSEVQTMARDWSISVFTDDFVSTTSAFTQPSWNYRSVLAAMGMTTFPLKTITPSVGVPTSVSLVGGGTAFLRFAVTPGRAATITWDALPVNLSLSLVRTR